MEKIKSTSRIEINVILNLTEIEARALHGITSYGSDEFLNCFF